MTTLTVREATPDDVRFVWETNNAPEVRAQSISTESIPWDDHVEWFNLSLASDERAVWVIIADEERCGVVRFDLVEDQATISIALNAEFRGRGIGRRSIATACAALFDRRQTDRVIAFVRPDNVPSVRAFEGAGFELRDTKDSEGVELSRYVLERT